MQCGAGVVLGGEAAAAHGAVVASGFGGGDLDGEGPGPVLGVGCQGGAVGAELVSVLVPASAPAIDAACGVVRAHGDHFLRVV